MRACTRNIIASASPHSSQSPCLGVPAVNTLANQWKVEIDVQFQEVEKAYSKFQAGERDPHGFNRGVRSLRFGFGFIHLSMFTQIIPTADFGAEIRGIGAIMPILLHFPVVASQLLKSQECQRVRSPCACRRRAPAAGCCERPCVELMLTTTFLSLSSTASR